LHAEKPHPEHQEGSSASVWKTPSRNVREPIGRYKERFLSVSKEVEEKLTWSAYQIADEEEVRHTYS
jgi:hypothetical protein